MTDFEKIVANISEKIFAIEHQLTGVNHPDIILRLKRAFPQNYDFDDDHYHNFEWNWRHLGRDDTEYYSSDLYESFRTVCTDTERRFKEVVGEATYNVETSSEYGWMRICIPPEVDIAKKKRNLFKDAVIIHGLREHSTDKVINVETDYVVVNRAASTEFLARLDAVIRLLGLTPVVKYRDHYIQINV
ncbi:hypothetical protein [Flavobacterium sp.]|uniref:hypothetical protein n=1 Tax=Flavobacterium sp. TaxID=239 RepID=UPI0026093530|nr:hypothetical protein [Flavobacterium sp.]